MQVLRQEALELVGLHFLGALRGALLGVPALALQTRLFCGKYRRKKKKRAMKYRAGTRRETESRSEAPKPLTPKLTTHTLVSGLFGGGFCVGLGSLLLERHFAWAGPVLRRRRRRRRRVKGSGGVVAVVGAAGAIGSFCVAAVALAVAPGLVGRPGLASAELDFLGVQDQHEPTGATHGERGSSSKAK